MSLKDEIAALRAEIDVRARRPPVDEKAPAPHLFWMSRRRAAG